MSETRGTSGQCLRRMSRQNSFFSHCQTVSMSAFSNPKSKPPIPAKKLATRTLGPSVSGLAGANLLIVTASLPVCLSLSGTLPGRSDKTRHGLLYPRPPGSDGGAQMRVASAPYMQDSEDRDRRCSSTYFDAELCETQYFWATALGRMPSSQP